MGFIDSIITGAFGIGQQLMQNNYNAEEAEKNRQFQSAEARLARNFDANQAALQRSWSSQEAEQARAWQEEMNAKYNSISGKIAQAEAAGVNPMFAVTGNAVSPASASASAPSGASASSHGSPSGSAATNGMLNILGAILDAKKLNSEIELNESEANKNNAQAEGLNITNEQLRYMNAAEIMSKLSSVELNDANIELISSKILNTDADTELKGAQLGQIAVQIVNTEADTAVKNQQIGLMLSEIAKNNKSLDVMEAEIAKMASSAGVDRANVRMLSMEFRKLAQDYTADEMLTKARQLATPDGSENAFEKLCYKFVALIKK